MLFVCFNSFTRIDPLPISGVAHIGQGRSESHGRPEEGLEKTDRNHDAVQHMEKDKALHLLKWRAPVAVSWTTLRERSLEDQPGTPQRPLKKSRPNPYS